MTCVLNVSLCWYRCSMKRAWNVHKFVCLLYGVVIDVMNVAFVVEMCCVWDYDKIMYMHADSRCTKWIGRWVWSWTSCVLVWWWGSALGLRTTTTSASCKHKPGQSSRNNGSSGVIREEAATPTPHHTPTLADINISGRRCAARSAAPKMCDDLISGERGQGGAMRQVGEEDNEERCWLMAWWCLLPLLAPPLPLCHHHHPHLSPIATSRTPLLPQPPNMSHLPGYPTAGDVSFVSPVDLS